jgi:hypothetical protein
MVSKIAVFTLLTMKNTFLWDVTLVALVESDVSDERIASFFVIAR